MDGADADIHFMIGGTQTNYTVIDAALRPYQSVICADTGHINCHEAGSIERTGHKILAVPAEHGKLAAFWQKSAFMSRIMQLMTIMCVFVSARAGANRDTLTAVRADTG